MKRLIVFVFVVLICPKERPCSQVTALRTDQWTQDGWFGRTVAVDGGVVAVGSREELSQPLERGAVAIFERDSSGDWVRTQLIRRAPLLPHLGEWSGDVELAGDSLMVMAGGLTCCYEFQRVGGNWRHAASIAVPAVLNPPTLGSILAIEFDGETLITAYPQALNGGNGVSGRAAFWKRSTSGWEVDAVFPASSLGIPPGGGNISFALVADIHGDFAVFSAPRAPALGFDEVGMVFTFRRVQGHWVHEQTIECPNIAWDGHYFGSGLALDDDWLFVGSPAEALGPTGSVGFDQIRRVYVFRRGAGGWEPHSTIEGTAGPHSPLFNIGFGGSLAFRWPTLLVNLPSVRMPSGGPGSPTGGSGSVYAYELCGDVWNQSLALTAPHDFGLYGLGFAGAFDFDGEWIALGSQLFTPASGLHVASGIAAVGRFPGPSSSMSCTEIGRVTCAPAAPETTDCPCGAGAVPGRGCPNVIGPGARLYLHGGFNQLEVRRVLLEGLPPGSTTMLALGRPVTALGPGTARGSGIVCINAPAAWRVGSADPLGTLAFDHVEAPWYPLIYSLAGLELPMQALYRTPIPDACGERWNASNAVQLYLE